MEEKTTSQSLETKSNQEKLFKDAVVRVKVLSALYTGNDILDAFLEVDLQDLQRTLDNYAIYADSIYRIPRALETLAEGLDY